MSASTTDDPSATDLPNFDRSPLVEVVMAAAFEPIRELTPARAGVMWQDVHRVDFPGDPQQKPPIVVQFERLGSPMAGPTLSFEAVDVPPWRSWFFSPDERTQIMQFQGDWMARNWRWMPGEEDPDAW